MKNINSLNLALLLIIIASIGAIVLQKHLPQKSFSIVPGPAPVLTYTYSAGPEGTAAKAEFIDQAKHHWQCVTQKVDDWLICSFAIVLANGSEGLDLTRYSNLNIKIDYQGTADRVRVGMRTFDPRFSLLHDSNSTKYHFIILRADDFNNDIQIKLSEFSVAEWWIDQFDVPRQLARPDLTNVISISVEFFEGLEPGNHEVTVDKMSFSGDLISPEKWYLGILGLWMLSTLTVVVVRMIKLNIQSAIAHQRITELAVTNSHLQTEKTRFQTLSNLDALTGIYNRYAIDKSIAQLLADPRKKNAIALIIIDIDHFKRVNDLHGHDVGDRILKQFTLVVGSNIRSDDIFGRWGGEEFLLICPKTTIDNAFNLAEKIRKILGDTVFEEDDPLNVTASFGVATMQRDEDFATAFKRLDAALYRAKSLGRNCTIIADTSSPD